MHINHGIIIMVRSKSPKFFEKKTIMINSHVIVLIIMVYHHSPIDFSRRKVERQLVDDY